MTDPISPPHREGQAEAVARIIDPEAFILFRRFDDGLAVMAEHLRPCREAALTKARSILDFLALSAPAEEGWRPIETAPTDGTPVDLWVDIVEEAPNSFHLENEPHRVARTYYADYRWFGGEWPWKPTHWRPLPAPPAEEGGQS